MKIIAENSDNFIVEISKREVANLVGHYSQYTKKSGVVGDEIEIHKMYKQLYELSRLSRNLKEAREILRATANHLELINPIKNKIEVPEKDKP